jgi:hypothetical protein
MFNNCGGISMINKNIDKNKTVTKVTIKAAQRVAQRVATGSLSGAVPAAIVLSALVVLSVSFVSSCSKKSNSSGSDSSNSQNSMRNPKVLNFLKLEPAVESQTPTALKPAVAVSRVRGLLKKLSGDPVCADTSDDIYSSSLTDDQKDTCLAALEVKERFYRPGPTEIRYWLGRLDETLAEYSNPLVYLPCLDPNNTAGMSYQGQNIPPYNLVTLQPRQTFPDSSTFNAIGSFKLSCVGKTTDQKSWNGIGIDNGVTYLAGGSTEDPVGMLAKIEANGDIDLWLTFKGTRSDFNFNATSHLPEVLAWGNGFDEGAHTSHLTYPMSTGIARLKAQASSNKIELTMTGVGLGDGCGARLITDGTYIFYQANRNFHGACFANDSGRRVLISLSHEEINHDTSAYEGSKADKRYCLRADEELLIPEETLTPCIERNLAPGQVVAAEGSEGTPAEVTLDQIFSLSMLTRQQIKAYNAPLIFQIDVNSVPSLVRVTVQPPLVDQENLATLVREEFFLSQTSHANNRASGWCRDQALTGSEQVNEPRAVNSIFTLGVLTEEELTKFNQSLHKELVVDLANGYVERDNASKAFWAHYNVTLTVRVNGNVVGVQSNVLSPNEVTNRGANRQVTIPFNHNAPLAPTDIVTVTMTGTNRYQCGALQSGATLNGLAAAASVTMSRPHLRSYRNP